MSVTWLSVPLFRSAGGWDAIVGIDEHGSWHVRLPGRTAPADSDEGAMPLLPLMEPGYGGTLDVARARVASALVASSLSAELAQGFPYHAPVLLAFTHMTGWTQWAADWLTELELTEPQAYALLLACHNRRLPQSARHAALRRVHRWEQERGYCFVRPRDR